MTKKRPYLLWTPEEEQHLLDLQQRFERPSDAFKVYQQEAEHPRTRYAFDNRWSSVKFGRMAASEQRLVAAVEPPLLKAKEEMPPHARFEDDEEAARPAKTRYLALATHTRGNAGKSGHRSDMI